MEFLVPGMHNDQRDEDAVAYMSQFDQVDMGIEFPHYEEPPPPYTPPKPPDIPHREAPPPYEATPGLNNPRETNNNQQGSTATTQPGGGVRGPRPTQGSATFANGQAPTLDEIPVFNNTIPERTRCLNETLLCHAQNMVQQSAMSPVRAAASQVGDRSPGERPGNHWAVDMQHGHRERLSRHIYSESESSDDDHHTSESDADDCRMSAASTLSSRVPVVPSPSHMLVRMHNNSLQSQLVRNPCDVMSRSAGSSSGGESTPGMRPASDWRRNEERQSRIPGGRTSFIKRSDSVEIKRGSNSPRNSFYLDNLSLGASVTEGPSQSGLGPDATPNHTSSSGFSALPHSDLPSRFRDKPEPPNVTWNKSYRPFRIRLDCDSGVSCDNVEPQGTVSGQNRTDARILKQSPPHSQPRPIKRHSTLVGVIEPGSPSPSPPSSFQEKHRFRHSLPPMDLELPSDPVDAILGASGVMYMPNENSGSATPSDPSPDDVRPEVGVSPSGSGRVTSESSSEGSPVYVNPGPGTETPPSISSPSVGSPQSPIAPFMVRSGSVTSQLSQFSVCSETGEKKRPRPNMGFPRSLRNDLRYPFAPFSSNYAAPMSNTPPIVKSSSQKPASPKSSLPDLPSPKDIGAGVQLSLASNNNPVYPTKKAETTGRKNKISYVEHSPEREKTSSDSSVTSPSSAGSASSGYPNMGSPSATSVTPNGSTPSSSLSPTTPEGQFVEGQAFQGHAMPKRSDSTASRGSQTDPVKSRAAKDKAERHTVRKVKKQNQKKRCSKVNAGPPEDVCNGDLTLGDQEGEGTTADPVSHSPERYRHMVRPFNNSTTYKQYGFIDDPNVINNARETIPSNNTNIVNGGTTQKEDRLKRRNSKEKHRDNSVERKRDNSRERHDNSCERKREGSRDRRRDSTHERRDNSGDRRRKDSRERGHREQSKHEANEQQDGCRRDRSNSGDRQYRNSLTNQQSHNRDTSPNKSNMTQRNNQITTGETDNMVCLTEPPTRVEGRKRERDYASQAASLERKNKRRSTGERLVPEPGQEHPSVSLSNGHILQPMDCNCNNGPLSPDCSQNEDNRGRFQGDRTKRTKNCRTVESRRSMPVIVHKN